MNLVPIRPALPVQTLLARCMQCRGHVRSDTGYADLHGVPFKEYYCDACAAVMNNRIFAKALKPLKKAS